MIHHVKNSAQVMAIGDIVIKKTSVIARGMVSDTDQVGTKTQYALLPFMVSILHETSIRDTVVTGVCHM